MYLVERLWILRNISPPDSPDYILACFFLDPSRLETRHTLTSVQDQTFISKSTIDRFCKETGFSNLRNFQSALIDEFTEIKDRMALRDKHSVYAVDYSSHLNSDDIKKGIARCASILKESKKIYVYGNQRSMMQLYPLISCCTAVRKPVITLSDWSIDAIRTKLAMCTEDDCLIVIDTDYNLNSLEIRLQIEEGVLKYSELASISAKKIFIGRDGAGEDSRFTVLALPPMKTDAEYCVLLSMAGSLIWERMN